MSDEKCFPEFKIIMQYIASEVVRAGWSVARFLVMVDDLERQVTDREWQAEALLQTVLAEAFGEPSGG